MNKLKKYENAAVATGTRRLAAIAIDALILCVVSFILLISYMAIVPNFKTYQTRKDTLTTEMNICYQMEEEAKIYQFEGEGENKYSKPRPMEDTFQDYCLMHILLAYEKDAKPFENYGVVIKNENNLPVASFETDNLAYFYVNYVPKYNNYNGQENDIVIMDKDPKLFFMDAYKKNAVKIDMWNYDNENYSLPYLDSDFAVDLYKYLFEDSSYQVGLTNYNYLAKNYMNLWSVQVQELLASSRFSTHYQIYKENYEICSRFIIVGVALIYLISFLLVIVLPQPFFKGDKTIGKKLMKVTVIDERGYETQVYQKVLRNFFLFFSYFPFMLIPCFLSGGYSSGWTYPIFEIGSIGVSLYTIMIVLGVISLISLLVMAISGKKKAFHDLILKTACIDDRYVMTQEEAAQLKKEEEEKQLSAKKADIQTEVLDLSTLQKKENQQKEDQ